MAYRKPQSINQAIGGRTPQMVVTMGPDITDIDIPGCLKVSWDIPANKDNNRDALKHVCEQIEGNISKLIEKP
jgi:hypothetical protein